MASEHSEGSASDPDVQTVQENVPAAAPTTASAYLSVVRHGQLSVVPIPVGQPQVFGRSESADVRLDDNRLSRSHCRLHWEQGAALLEDLGSSNGTRVNGQRIHEPQALSDGDLIHIGGVQMIFQRGDAVPARELLDEQGLLQRLRAELDRSLRSGQPLAVVVTSATSARTGEHITNAMRSSDVVARYQGGLGLLFLDTAAEQAQATIGRALKKAQAGQPDLRAGYARWPHDATTAEALLELADGAQSAAGPGTVAAAKATELRIEAGGHHARLADPASLQAYALTERLGKTALPVLILGETGVGKELFAAAIHELSDRSGGPYVAVNCASLPESLVESELFGHTRGAFTGAQRDRVGHLEASSGGTLFLDEIGEMPLSIQAKLLRVLEEHSVTRLGESTPRPVDLRVVAATHRNLDTETEQGRFRRDLYYRLSVGTLFIPPLRERPGDIPVLTRMFMEQACERANRPPMSIERQAMRALREHAWPGNVRELRNAIERAVATASGTTLQRWSFPEPISGEPVDPARTTLPPLRDGGPTRSLQAELKQLERDRIEEALGLCQGNGKEAAKLLQMPLRTFYYKAKQYGLNARKS